MEPSTDMSARVTALINSNDLLKWLGFSRAHLRTLTLDHHFPQPLKLSGRNYRWRVEEVERWLKTVGTKLTPRG